MHVMTRVDDGLAGGATGEDAFAMPRPASDEAAPARVWLLKRAPSEVPADVPASIPDEREDFGRIRCPACGWQPPASSLWSCLPTGFPEHFTGGCGTSWNTISTRGLCPGCRHQWRWTRCFECRQWSLHDDWYVETPDEA
jgi:hypothetical protein